jgi:hypothetical protein
MKTNMLMLAVRVGFEPRVPFEIAQVIDYNKPQKRSNRSFRRSEVHGGYMDTIQGQSFGWQASEKRQNPRILVHRS